jgi:hypothetical protein
MAGYFYLDGTYYNQMPEVLLTIFLVEGSDAIYFG